MGKRSGKGDGEEEVDRIKVGERSWKSRWRAVGRKER
jgi:hypothetical protein